MAESQETPPNTADNTKTDEAQENVVVSTLNIGDITPPTEQSAPSDFQPRYLDQRPFPYLNTDTDQPGTSYAAGREPLVQGSTRPYHGAPELGQDRSERGPAIERGRQNQAHQQMVQQYFYESATIKRKLQSISALMINYSGDHKPLSMRKQGVQTSMEEIKEQEEDIQKICPTPEVSDDYAILAVSMNGMIESFRDLCPYASSDMVSTIWSSSPGSVHADNQAYKDMMGKKRTLGAEETEALTELEQQRSQLRRLQEKLDDEKRTQARQAQKLVEEQKEKDQEELDEQQRQAEEHKRQEDHRRRQEDNRRKEEEQDAEYRYQNEQERIRREKASRERAQKLLESELKEKIDESTAEKAKIVRMKLDEIEVKKTEVSAHFKQQVTKAEEDMMAEIEQPSPPPPDLEKIDMINVYKKGPSSLDGLKKAILDGEATKNAKLTKVVSQQGSGLVATEATVLKGNTNAPLMPPPRNSTPITSFQDPPSTTKLSSMQTTAAAQPTVQSDPQHNFVNEGGENPNVILGGSTVAVNRPIQMSALGYRPKMKENATYAQRNLETPAAVQRVQQQVLKQIENRMRITAEQNPQQEEERDQCTSAAELNPAADAFYPGYQRQPVPQLHGEASFASAEHTAATQLLASSIKQSRLPKQEPLTFEGDPLLYSAWKNTFALIIEAQDISEVERLLYLQNYVKGPAKDAISGAFASASPTAYSTAMATLDERFGSPLVIATAYREKLESWPVVGMKDSDSLRKIADFLNECLSATRQVGQTAIFEDVLYQKKVLDKLPDWMRRKWQRNYSETRQKRNRYPTFSEFVQYINAEATIANEPGWTQSKGTTDVTRSNKRPNTYNTFKAQPDRLSVVVAQLSKQMDEVKKGVEEFKNVQTATAFQVVPPSQIPWKGSPTQRNSGASFRQSPPQHSCAYCRMNDHDLSECGEVMKMSPAQRQAVFVDGRLCFRCGSSSHMGRDCPRTSTCHTCKKGHPTVLHGTYNLSQPTRVYPGQQQQASLQQRQGYNRPSDDARITSGSYPSKSNQDQRRDPHQTTPKVTTRGIQTVDVDQLHSPRVVDFTVKHKSTSETSTQTVSVHYSSPVRTTMIVPVYVSSPEEPEKEILTYALLDTQAGVTFVAEELAKQLKTKGYSHPLRINTLTAKNRLTPSTAVLNLRVRAVDSRELLQLPVSYSTDILSVDPKTIPTPETARKHDHLKHLASQMTQYDPNCCAGLLIGYDNPIALMPIEVIQGTPYAIKTCLGWSVIGEQQPHASVDSMMTSPAMTTTDSLYTMTPGVWDENGLPQVVSNVFRTHVQEATTTDVLRLMERDFVENERGHKSQEDTKFLQIMNDRIRKNEKGHYEMPLPFKKEDQEMPCNRPSAAIRLLSLKRQLTKDPRKKELYIESMAKLLEQGHAERVPEEEMSDRVRWYIPHHGVVNDKKPRLIRSARRILNGLLSDTHTRFTPSTLRTLLYEVMAIMNSRPLSTESLEDPSGPLPLTPNHILTFKSTGILPPPGVFRKEDLSHRSQWKKVQHLADKFWERWRTDYLATLQMRRKWHHARPNLAVNDLVLIKDENLCRSQWRMGRVTKVHVSDDGLVRRCQLRVANPAYQPQGPSKAAATTLLDRHIHSLVLFVEGGETTPAEKTIEENEIAPATRTIKANVVAAPRREEIQARDTPDIPISAASRKGPDQSAPSEMSRVPTRIPIALRRLETTLNPASLQSTRDCAATRTACKSPYRRREATPTSRRATPAVNATTTTGKHTARTRLEPSEKPAAIATHSQPFAAAEGGSDSYAVFHAVKETTRMGAVVLPSQGP